MVPKDSPPQKKKESGHVPQVLKQVFNLYCFLFFKDVIFTEPDFLTDPLFSGFMKMRLARQLNVKVLSYFAIYKIILSVPGSEERKRIYEIFG